MVRAKAAAQPNKLRILLQFLLSFWPFNPLSLHAYVRNYIKLYIINDYFYSTH